MKPPGPRTPAIYQTYRYITDPAGYLKVLRGRYGDVASFRTLLGNGVAVMDPKVAKDVFAAPPELFEPADIIPSVFGSKAVISVGGEPHRRLRKLLNPRFHGAQIKGFLGAMKRAITDHRERFAGAAERGEAVVLMDVTQSMALDVILETVFAAGTLDRDRARTVLRGLIHSFSPLITGGKAVHKAWFPPWRRFTAARATLGAWVDGVVAERRRRGEDDLGDDVLGVLLAARYEDGTALDGVEIRDQLLTILLAGHETSATAMAWAMYHLTRTPEVLATLRAEIDALGPDPAPEQIVKLRYLDAVISEALRIEPIVTDVVRVCREPFQLGAWTVPRGEVIAVMVVSILGDERVFPEPERFRPERFLEKKYGPSELLPFGGGARRCVGAAFAEAELSIAVADMVTHWDFELASAEPERSVRRNLTMGPKNGVRVRVRPRKPSGTRADAA